MCVNTEGCTSGRFINPCGIDTVLHRCTSRFETDAVLILKKKVGVKMTIVIKIMTYEEKLKYMSTSENQRVALNTTYTFVMSSINIGISLKLPRNYWYVLIGNPYAFIEHSVVYGNDDFFDRKHTLLYINNKIEIMASSSYYTRIEMIHIITDYIVHSCSSDTNYIYRRICRLFIYITDYIYFK
jgi:hypothetical protein